MLGNSHQSSLGFRDYLMNIKLLIEYTNSFSDASVIQPLQIGNKLNQKIILLVYGFLKSMGKNNPQKSNTVPIQTREQPVLSIPTDSVALNFVLKP